MMMDTATVKASPKIVFSKSERSLTISEPVEVFPNVGPGAHKPEQVVDFLSNRARMPTMVWSQSKRVLSEMKVSPLGPGAYEVRQGLGDSFLNHSSPSFSLGARRPERKIPERPGPGEYGILPIAGSPHRSSQPSYTISASRRGWEPDYSGGNPLSPGPAAHTIDDAHNSVRLVSPSFTLKSRSIPAFKPGPVYESLHEEEISPLRVPSRMSRSPSRSCLRSPSRKAAAEDLSPPPFLLEAEGGGAAADARPGSRRSPFKELTSPLEGSTSEPDTVPLPMLPSTSPIKRLPSRDRSVSRQSSRGKLTARPQTSTTFYSSPALERATMVYGKSFGPQTISRWGNAPSFTMRDRFAYEKPLDTPGPGAHGSFALPHIKSSVKPRSLSAFGSRRSPVKIPQP